MKQYFLSLMFLVFLSACSPSSELPPSKTANSLTPVAADRIITKTSSPTSSYTPTPTITSPPTRTPTVTTSPTSTPTPTMALPVDLSLMFPKLLKIISSENISELQEIAFEESSPLVNDYTITADGKLGFVNTTKGMGIYDIAGNQLLEYFIDSQLSSLSYDGNYFSVISNHQVQIRNLSAGVIFEIPYSGLSQISPDGKLFAIYSSDTTMISIYDVGSAQIVSELPVHQYGASENSRLLFSPDGSWFVEWEAWGGDGTIWKTSDWTIHREIDAPYPGVRGFSPDGEILVLQDESQIILYQVENWKLKKQLNVRSDKTRSTLNVFFSPSGDKLAVWESDWNLNTLISEYSINVWDIPTGEHISEQKMPVARYAFLVADDGSIFTYQIPDAVCSSLNINPEISCKEDFLWLYSQVEFDDYGKQFQWWKKSYGGLNEGCTIEPGFNRSCLQSSELMFLNSDSEFYGVRKSEEQDTYELYNGFDGGGSAVGSFRSQAENIYPQWLGSDGRWFLFKSSIYLGNMARSTAAELWDIQSETRIKKWSDWLYGFSVNPDEDWIAMVFDNQMVIYSLRDSRVLYSKNFDYMITGKPRIMPQAKIAFIPGGDLVYATIAIAHEENNNIWFAYEYNILDAETFESRPIFKAEVGMPENDYWDSIEAIAPSPDGSLLAIGLPDGFIHVIDLESGQDIYSWKAHNGSVSQLDFSIDGTFLLSSSVASVNGPKDGLIKIWGIWP